MAVAVRVSLVKELCRVFDSGERAVLCALSHGQITVDGYVVKPSDDMRWTRAQLGGRMAICNHRQGRLFGMSQRCRTPTTSDANDATPVGS